MKAVEFGPRTFATGVWRDLLAEIVNGRLAPGDQLPPVGKLSATYGVSRQVIREAMKHLESLGVLSLRQGKPAVVAPRESWNELSAALLAVRRQSKQTDEVLLELLELRRIVDIEAAALAATRATEASIERLSALVIAMDNAIGDPSSFASIDVEFHYELLIATRNRLLPLLFDQLRPLLEYARQISAAIAPGGQSASQSGHHAILDAIKAQRPEQARAAVREHLSWTANLRLEDLDKLLAIGTEA